MRPFWLIVCFACAFFFATETEAQVKKKRGKRYVPKKYMHSIGGSYVYNYLDDGNAQAIGLTYSPRYRISKVSPNSSVTIGTNLTGGYNFAFKDIESGTQDPYYFEIPVFVMLNIGQGSLYRTRRGTGSFFALGGGVNSIKNVTTDKKTQLTNVSEITYGIYGALGIRFLVNQYYSYGISGYTLMGKNGAIVLGARVLYNFGLYETY